MNKLIAIKVKMIEERSFLSKIISLIVMIFMKIPE